ncbi:MAG: hypothetical protein U9Q20_06045 [Campylobacterota bacterium]|nr:hypothetical protein [Campylobacterota bacterium]
MTKIQVKFYNIIIKQIIDYEEIFHKEFIKARIEQIPDDQLKYLLENINLDKDKIVNKKGYMTYAKFIYYADKMIDSIVSKNMLPKISKVEELYNKRSLLINTIENQTTTIQERNDLIENLKNKVVMFKDKDKNILDEGDYFIIEKFGFFNFFDENKNYHIKEDIEKYLKLYTTQKVLVVQ